MERWDTVSEFRKYQKRFKEDVDDLRARKEEAKSDPAKRQYFDAQDRRTLERCTKMHNWLGTTFDSAYECASTYLKDSPAAGKPAIIKASYLRVRRDMQDPLKATRYVCMERDLLEALGFAVFEDELWVGNFLYFHCLTE